MKKIAIIIVVSFIFAFFRFYKIDKRISFDWDQEQFSYQAKQIILQHKPILIGTRITSDAGFFLGPYLYYVSTPFYLLTHLHPRALILFVISVQIIFFLISFLVLKKIHSLHVSLLFLFLWSTNSLTVIYDITPWGPLLIPLGVIIVWYLLYKFFETNRSIYVIFLGVALGFFVNIHFQFILMPFFTLVFLLASPHRGRFLRSKKIFLLVFSFLAMFVPLILFDLRHDFLNSKLFMSFLQHGGVESYGRYAFAWLPVFANFMQPFVGINNVFISMLFYLLILVVLFFLFRRKRDFHKTFYFSTFVLWIVFVAVFLLYAQRGSEYYFYFLSPFIYFTLSDLLLELKKPLTLGLVILFFLFINGERLYANLKDNEFGLYFKDQIAQEIKKYTKSKTVNISYTVPLGLNHGYQYLFDYYQIKQSDNPSIRLIQIKIPAEGVSLKRGAIGVILPSQ
ncbi:MAG TPA: glycosyltransferase family 39 protein [Patescibacteria group bacterium]|nr:glycosyltransferase family 39 protein [Patescibacteria group bacterium]